MTWFRVAAVAGFTVTGLLTGCATTGAGDSPAESRTPADAPPDADGEWTDLFDGESLAGWKSNENHDSWSVQDGAIVAKGAPKSHLFYENPGAPYVNFVLQLQVMARNNSNGGVYFHTRFQDGGWPKYGFEAQVNNTFEKDHRKTGSLYSVDDVTEQLVGDDEWFDYEIRVEAKHVVISVNGKIATDYTEPDDAQPGEDFTRVVGAGTFALQAHDPDSEVHVRNIRVKRLP